jgi:DNA-binding response OmpR family regulator
MWASGLCLLLVEDEESNRLTLEALLEDEGFQVECATTSHEAEQRIATRRYDVVVLDRGLGDRDGLSLVPQIRERLPRARVVVLSGQPDNDSESTGVDAWLTKGADVRLFLQRLERLVTP